VVDTHQELAARNRVSLRPVLAKRLLPGGPLLLERLVGNLVANAIKYNEPGGWVEVEVTSDSGLALTVLNTGQAVPAEAMPALFEPFRRRTADRTDQGSGAGLGLSIVRSITTAHGGTVRAQPRPGGGLIVEIDLPPLPTPPAAEQPLRRSRSCGPPPHFCAGRLPGRTQRSLSSKFHAAGRPTWRARG
jgi:signal transduction histidine kinase